MIGRIIRQYKYIDGWLTGYEAYGLYQYSKRLPKNAIVVEIGTWKGKSTYCIAKGLKSSGKIYAIDPFDASGDKESASIYSERRGDDDLLSQFKNRMKKLNVHDKIIPMKGLSSQFVGSIKEIDFLFIDGDHSIDGCHFDFSNYSPYIKKYGYIAFHDYDPARIDLGPTWVVGNKVMKSKAFRLADQFDSLWIAQKIL